MSLAYIACSSQPFRLLLPLTPVKNSGNDEFFDVLALDGKKVYPKAFLQKIKGNLKRKK